jgi:Sec-independent protein secretion pathway component TatC
MALDDAAARARRQRQIHRAGLYTYAFLAAGVGIAAVGAALIAWLLSRTGLPFLETWIVLTLVILVPSGIALVWRAVRERTRGPSSGNGGATPPPRGRGGRGS